MLYTKPIDEINWDDVAAFCEQRIPEGSYLDYKEDFPRSLEKTIAAMANTIGGVILIGVAEDQESKPQVPIGDILPIHPCSDQIIQLPAKELKRYVGKICSESGRHDLDLLRSNNTRIYSCWKRRDTG